MKPVFRHSQLYTFLLYCNKTNLEKKILDCGAGGDTPPLSIFKDHGYETFGIDISDDQIKRAKKFEDEHQVNLNINKGDMLSIPYNEEFFSYVYSYNSIFHMSKENIRKTIQEIRRVMKVGGLAFINFASTNDDRSTVGEKVKEGEYLQEEYGDKILHSYFYESEAEDYFDGFDVIFKENRIRDGYRSKTEKIRRGYIDYILIKKGNSI